MPLPFEVVLHVHTDPAHSYFEVDALLIDHLNIAPSELSFVSPDKQKYFLDVDVDAVKLIDSLSAQHISFSFEEVEHKTLAFFRKYRSAGVFH